jgi:alpha-galactosidase
LAFRAVTALFGHFGIEWNLLDATDEDRRALAGWIALYKEHRALLHGGDVVRIDAEPDTSSLAHGVLAADRNEALVAYVQLGTPASLSPSRLRVPELDAERRYVARLVEQPGVPSLRLHGELPIVEGTELTGRQLDRIGVQLPVLLPETAHLVHIAASR